MKKNVFQKIKLIILICQIIISSAFVALIYIYSNEISKAFYAVLILLAINFLIYTIYNHYFIKVLQKEKQKSEMNMYSNIDHNTPLPCMLVNVHTKKIVWTNTMLLNILDKKDVIGKFITEIIDIDESNFSDDSTIEGINDYKIAENYYDIKFENIKKKNKSNGKFEMYKSLYFFDETQRANIKQKYEEARTLFGYVYIDNFEEILNTTEETKRPMMLGIIERKLQTFAKELNGTIKKMERDRFLLLISKESLEKVIESKFKILEEIRKINVGNEFPITLSMGFSLVGDNIDVLMENSKDAAELAISRGGDQAVIKKEENEYEYYGAKVKQEIEGSNAVRAKARIKAYALKELITSVDNVLIMGHKNPDLDALGAAIGMHRLATELGKKSRIILDEPNSSIEVLYNKIKQSQDYEEDVFITSEDAMKFDYDDTVLIVVDVNIPGMTECPEIIEKIDRIAIIDHHIRGAQFIEKAKVIYLDPFASSACEEVVQMIQYIVEKVKFTEVELDGMLAGILVDTKKFMYKTGVKTFEAAAYLKKCGADNIRVKFLFQNDIDSFRKKAEAMKKAEVYKDKIVITICPTDISNPYALVAQIADELLNITGIEASFVIYDTGEGVCNVSARSDGNINVQIIAEGLGGGGHFTAAGIQLRDLKPNEVVKEIKKSIDLYLEEGKEVL